MALRKGSKVVIARNLGMQNRDDEGGKDDYYFQDTGTIDDIPLRSKGEVVSVYGDEVEVSIEDADGDVNKYLFHRKELAPIGQDIDREDILKNLPEPYLFILAAQSPLFVINDRLYYTSELRQGLTVNFFQSKENGQVTQRALIESASIPSLERLFQRHFAPTLSLLKKKYAASVIEEDTTSRNLQGKKYKIVDFIYNEVFPYFRKNGQEDKKIALLLGIKNQSNETIDTRIEKNGPCTATLKKDPFIARLIRKIDREQFSSRSLVARREQDCKLDALLADTPIKNYGEKHMTYPQNYCPVSVFGKVVEGKNVAIVNGMVYNFAPKSVDSPYRVKMAGKSFSLASQQPVSIAQGKYLLELSKQLRIAALEECSEHKERSADLHSGENMLKRLARMKNYSEGTFGFVRDDDYEYQDKENSWYNGTGPVYHVFCEVPAHVLKEVMDDDDYFYEDDREQKKDTFYSFGSTKVAVPVFINDNEGIEYDHPICLDQGYEDPFTNDGTICVGEYGFGKLERLKRGEAVARLLIDTKNILLSGYTERTRPVHYASETGQRIYPHQIRKRKLLVTNINIGRGRWS